MKPISFVRLALVCSFLLGVLTTIQAQTPNYGTVTGSNISVNVPGNFGGNYYAGHAFIFLSNASIPGGATTLSINGQAPRNLYKNVNQNLAAGDILAGQAVQVLYDGTNFQVLNVGSVGTSISTGGGTGSIGAFSSRLTNSQSVTTLAGTIWNVVDYNTNNWFNPATGRYTPQEAGYYNFISTFRMGSYSILPALYKNGAPIVQFNADQLNYVDYANGADYYEIRAEGNALGSPNPSGYYPTYFQAFKINGSGILTVTSFSGSTASGIATLNGLTTPSQNFSISSTGTSVNIVSSGNTHTFNVPLTTLIGGNNITVTGTFPVFTISGLASTSTGAGTGSLHTFRVTRNTPTPVPGILQFNTKLFDTDNEFSLASYRFTPQEIGFYNFSASAIVQDPGGNFTGQISIRKNGTDAIIGTRHFTSGGNLGIIANGVLFANGVSDYFDVFVSFPIGSSNATYMEFSGFKINGGSTMTVTNFIGGSSTTGISALNSLTSTSQNFQVTTVGSSIGITSLGNTHTFAIPAVSVVGGNNITVTGSFPLYTVSGVAGATGTSQWVSTTNGIYSSSPVGIGNQPNGLYPLQVDAGSGLALMAAGGGSTAGNANTYFIMSRSASTSGIIQMDAIHAGFNNAPLVLNASFGGAPVGIGTSSPQNTLDVAGSGRFSGPLFLSSLSTGGTTLPLGVNNLGQLVTIAGGTSTSQWVSTTGGIYYNNGNVGIGTTSGSNKLVVSDNITNGGILKLQSSHNQNGDNWWIGFVHGGATSDANDRARIGVAPAFSGAGEVYITTGVAGSQVERLRVNQGGNVGIATSTPGALLDVNGNARFAGPVSISGLATGGTTQALGVNNLGQLVTIAGGTSTSQWVSTTGGIYYSGGNVGIGTNSPLATLDVANSSGTAGIRINAQGPSTYSFIDFANSDVNQWGMGNFNGNFYIDKTSAGNVLNITPTGLVSLGNAIGSTPGVHLRTNTSVTGTLFVSGISTLGGLKINNLLGPGTVTVDGLGNIGVGPNLSSLTSTSQWITNGTNIFYNTGNVGIGTSTPGTALLNLRNTNGTGTIPTVIVINQDNAVRNYTGFNLQRQGVERWFVGMNEVNDNFILRRNGSADLLRLNSSGNSFFVGLNAGTSATGINNNFIGQFAGYFLTTGTANLGLGYQAGVSLTVGSGNVFLGENSGTQISTGNNNVTIGKLANTNGQTNLTNAIAIGYNAQVGASNSMVLGGTGIDAVNVGIGVNIPTARLDVNGDARIAGPLTITSFSGGGNQNIGVNNNGQLVILGAATSQWSSNGANIYYTIGNVGIGSTTPGTKLDVSGTTRLSGPVTITSFAGGGTQALGVNNLGQLVTISGGTATTQWVTTTSGIYSPVNAAIGTAPDPTFNFKVAGNQIGPTPAQLILQGSTDPNQQLMMGYNTQSSVAGGEWGSIQAIKQFSGPVPLVLQNYGGNVGIGTNNPLAKLTVNGNASISGITTLGGLNLRNLVGPGTVTVDGVGNIGVDATSSTSQWTTTTSSTIFYNGGNVEIGYPAGGGGVFNVSSTGPGADFRAGYGTAGAALRLGVKNNVLFATPELVFYAQTTGGMTYVMQSIVYGSGPGASILLNPGAGNVGIGVSASPSAKFTVGGTVSISGLTTVGGLNVRNLIGPGTVTVDGLGRLGVSTSGGSSITGSGTTNGVAFWTNASTLTSDGTSFIYTPSTKSLKVGNAILSSNSASGNVFFGSNVGNQTMSGTDNNFFGTNIGQSNTLGKNNNFFGNAAGSSNVLGESNNYFGQDAGYRNQFGSYNNAMGYQAGYGNISGIGSNNNSFGQGSGFNNEGDGNNFMGFFAGRNNTSGDYNNFFGQSAGLENTTGDDNIFIGQESGLNNTTGSENIGIGKNTGFTSSNLQNAIAIGSYASVGGSNMMALGGVGLYAVKVGIGTALPQNTLDVVGGARIRNLSVSGAVFANSNGDLYVNTTSSLNLWTISGSTLSPTNSSYGVNIGTSITSTGLVNISSTTSPGLVVNSTNLPNQNASIMANSYSNNSAAIGAFSYGSSAVGIFAQATQPTSVAINANNSSGGSAIKATSTGLVNPVAEIDFTGFSNGTGLLIDMTQSTNSGTGLLINTISPNSTLAMDVTGRIQFRNYTGGTLTVDGLGNLGVATVTSATNVGFSSTENTPQLIPTFSGTWTNVIFSTELFDDGNNYSGGLTFTCPVNGVYQINAAVPFSNIGQVDIAISVDGVNVVVNSVSTSPTTGVVTSVPISGLLKLTSGQTVRIRVRQFSGANQNTAVSLTGANASFSMVRLY